MNDALRVANYSSRPLHEIVEFGCWTYRNDTDFSPPPFDFNRSPGFQDTINDLVKVGPHSGISSIHEIQKGHAVVQVDPWPGALPTDYGKTNFLP